MELGRRTGGSSGLDKQAAPRAALQFTWFQAVEALVSVGSSRGQLELSPSLSDYESTHACDRRRGIRLRQGCGSRCLGGGSLLERLCSGSLTLNKPSTKLRRGFYGCGVWGVCMLQPSRAGRRRPHIRRAAPRSKRRDGEALMSTSRHARRAPVRDNEMERLFSVRKELVGDATRAQCPAVPAAANLPKHVANCAAHPAAKPTMQRGSGCPAGRAACLRVFSHRRRADAESLPCSSPSARTCHSTYPPRWPLAASCACAKLRELASTAACTCRPCRCAADGSSGYCSRSARRGAAGSSSGGGGAAGSMVKFEGVDGDSVDEQEELMQDCARALFARHSTVMTTEEHMSELRKLFKRGAG
eukprot:364694-Chlamydomonas_euryale.AAC.2